MPEYKHGAYGEINAAGNRISEESQGAMVYIGTAPVHNIAGGANNVNVPILVRNIAEARKYFGYSEDWAGFTLCEAMHVHFDMKGVGPVVFINVLDPAKHYKIKSGSVSKTPSDGGFTIADAENIDLSTISITVTGSGTAKTEGTDYTMSYDPDTKVLTVTEKSAGALGSAALTVAYECIDVQTVSKTPSNGVITITGAEDIILDSVDVVTKTKGTDYTVAYDIDRKKITITEKSAGSLGTSALSIAYKVIDPTTVSNSDVIGSSDGLGLNTGIFAIKDVYQLTGYIPSYVVCPGFSSIPAVHAALYQNSVKVNGHWDLYMFTDLPITNGGTDLTLDTIFTFKKANSYTHENETPSFPLVEGTDGKKYHLSVLRAANFQELLLSQDGIPYRTASNTEAAIIQNLYLGEAYAGRIVDDSIINEKLNKNGIASAAYLGGHWVLWGAHCGDYDQDNATQINVAETNRLMMYYISNDFQARRSRDVDQPVTKNDILSIVSEEQARLDALVNIGALIFGEVSLNASEDAKSDMLNGDWSLNFRVTTTPLAKSFTAVVTWTDEGFVTYFEEEETA